MCEFVWSFTKVSYTYYICIIDKVILNSVLRVKFSKISRLIENLSTQFLGKLDKHFICFLHIYLN